MCTPHARPARHRGGRTVLLHVPALASTVGAVGSRSPPSSIACAEMMSESLRMSMETASEDPGEARAGDRRPAPQSQAVGGGGGGRA